MKNKLAPILIIVLAIIVSINYSCSVGKNYKRPALNLPDKYRGVATNDTNSIGDIPWRAFFKDAVLIALIDSALINNFDMRVALKNIDIADQYVRESRAKFAPSINAQIGGNNTQFRSEDFYSNPLSNYYNGAQAPSTMYVYTMQNSSFISLSWEIDVWGKIRREKEAALATFAQNHELVKAVKTRIVAEIAQGYYNLLMLDQQLKVAKRNAALNDSTLTIVKLQRDAGQVTSLAMQQIEAQKLVAEMLIPQLESQIFIQENALQLLIGRNPNEIIRSAELEDFVIDDTLTTGVPLNMVSYRPDVAAQELQLKAANARVGVAQSYMYPAFRIDLSGGLNSMLAGNWFNIPGALFGNVFGGILQPIFQQRKLRTNYKVAMIERDKAEINFQKTVMTSVGEISNALYRVQKLKEEHDIAVRRVQVLALAVNNASLLFKSGMATYIEVITAQSNALRSELDLANVKLKYLNACVELYRSLGGGWK